MTKKKTFCLNLHADCFWKFCSCSQSNQMTSTDSTTLTCLQSAASVSEQSCDSPDTEDADSDETDSKLGTYSCSSQHHCDTPLIETSFSTLNLPPLPDSDEEDSIASLQEENFSSNLQISPESDNLCEQSCAKSKHDERESLLDNLEFCSPIDGTTETFIASRASNDRGQSGLSHPLSKSASDLYRDNPLSSDTSSEDVSTVLAPTPAADRDSSDSHLPSNETDERDQDEFIATQVPNDQSDMHLSRTETPDSTSEKSGQHVDESLSVRLEQANETIRHLLQSRDAMLSSVESLKVLVNSERVVTMATKRKLIATETKLHQEEKSHKDEIAAHTRDFEAQLDEMRQSKSSLETNLRETQSLVHDRDEKIQNLTEIHVTAVSERDSTVSKVSGLLSQLDQRDGRIACLSVQLQDESAKAKTTSNKLDELDGKLKNYDAIIVERDNLQEQCRILKEELDIHNNSVAERGEERERERLTNASELEQLQKKLQGESIKVTEMQESMRQLESLRKQAAEFDSTFRRDRDEDQVHVEKSYDALVSMGHDDSQNGRSQLLLASVCIQKRDEEILELREELDDCRNSEREAKSSSETALNTLENIRDVLGATQNEVTDLRDLTNAEREARISAEGKVKLLEEKLQIADQNIAQEREAASASKSGADTEIDQLKRLLDQANQKISTLEKCNGGKRPISHNAGASSPCSAEENANDRLLFAQTDCGKLSSLAELEEAANLSLSGIKKNAMLRRKPARSEADLLKVKSTTINIDGKTSQPASESLDVESIESSTKIFKLQEALKSLKHELGCKDNEYKAAMRHIESNLLPALEAANSKLDQTKSQLKLAHKQLRDCETCAESEKSTLQKEIDNLSSQLRETLVSLDNSRNELKRSDENVRQLEARIHGLETEKAECVGTIGDLQEECDRRGKSLAIIRDRLESIESRVGEYKQSVLDMEIAKNEVEKIARTEKEGRFVAEQRVIQTDELRNALETKYHNLAKEKGDIEVHSNLLLGRIQELQNQVFDLELALKEAMASMHSQARYSRTRDEKNNFALKELNDRLQERGQHLSKREHDLSCAQERISKLSSDLVWNKEKLYSQENEIGSLNRDNDEKDILLNRKRDHIRQLEEELADSKANCAEAEAEISQQRGELCRMRSIVDEKVDLVVNLTNENGALERRVEVLEKDISSEKEHSAYSDSLLLDVQKELSVVQNKLQRSEKELKKQINEAKLLKDLVEKSQNATNHAEKVIGEKEHDLIRKQKRADELEDVLLCLKQELASLQSAAGRDNGPEKKSGLNAESSTVEENGLAPISSAKQQLTELVGGLRSEIASREQAEVELKKRFCELEAEKDGIVQKLNLSCSQATKEKGLLMERIRNQESVVAEKELLINELEENIGKFDVFKAQSEEHLEEFRRQNEQSKSKIVAIEQKLSEEKDHRRAKSEELLQVETQLASRDKEVFALEKELKRLSKRSMDIVSPRSGSAMVESKEEAVERLREWCSFINRKLRVAEKESVEREAQLLESGEAVKRLQSELTRLQDKLRGKDSEIRKLTYMQELEVSQLTSRMDALRASFGNMSGSLPHSINDLAGLNGSSWFGRDTSYRGSDEHQGCRTTDAGKGALGGWPSRWDSMHSPSKHAAPRSQSATKLSTQLALAEYSSASRRGTSSTSGGLEQVCSVRFTLSGSGSPAADVVVYVIGGDVTLGQWDASRRIALRVVYDDSRRSGGEDILETVTDGVVRQCDVLVPASVVTWYKYVADAADGSILWERGNNRLLCLDGQPFYTTNDVWRD